MIPTPSHSAPSGSTWQVFSAAPHRMVFLAGVLQLILVMGLWLLELLARTGPALLPALTIAPIWAHMFLMLYGLFPFFIFGFLFTVYPRWMATAPLPATRYVPVFALLVAGMALFYAGLFAARPLLVTGMVVYFLGWVLAIHALIGVYRRARDRGPHERLLNVALSAGAFGVLTGAYGLQTEQPTAILLARELGLWLFLVPVLFTVTHRMLPFFSSSALPQYEWERPAWSLPLMAVCVAGHAALESAGWAQWLFLFDLPLAAAALYHTLRWHIRRTLEVRLLGMLHIAFLWFGAAMALYALQSVVLLATHRLLLGRAPLHALGIGFVTAMLVGMAARVTLGHSGRPLVSDRLTWYVFLGINLVAALRIGAELAPGNGYNLLNVTAAAGWLACFIPWVWRYAPMYLRPRVDGNPG